MLTAARAQRSCPQCTRQVLSLFEAGIASARNVESHVTLRNSTTQTSQRLLAASRPRRLFSSTRVAAQNAQPEPDKQPETDLPSSTPDGSSVDEIDVIVRQARQAFGKTLPKGYLNEEEYRVYERLYGPPLRDTLPEDVGFTGSDSDANAPYEDYVTIQQTEVPEEGSVTDPKTPHSALELPSEAGQNYVNAIAKNQREYDALIKLQKDFEQYNLENQESLENTEPNAEEEVIDEQEEDDIDEEAEEDDDIDLEAREESEGRKRGRAARLHDFTRLGLWRTDPSTVHLPKNDLVSPIAELLTRTDPTHIKQAAELAFGGPGLPFSVATPPSKRNVTQRAIGLEAGQGRMSEIEADAFLATNYPGMYATATSILVEVRKRLGSQWLHELAGRNGGDGPRMLDVGAGGAAAAAWQEVLNAEFELARERGEASGQGPKGKKTIVVGNDRLRHRVSRFLNDSSFISRLPDYLHSGDHPDKIDDTETPLPRKRFDIIIVSHMLMPLKEDWRRKNFIDNLWKMLSPEGGILIVLEKGMPRGFEAVADVRARLLNEFIEAPASEPQVSFDIAATLPERERGSIIAPCTNHKACPMYLTPGLSPGRKDFCHFSQRFIRPPFLQSVLDAKWRNHENIDFSFVAVQRGGPVNKDAMTERPSDIADRAFHGFEHAAPGTDDAPHAGSLPRQILPPIKRTGHVTLDLCTPAGTIERWTIPKSFSKQAYHDARKAKWGDLWALGAKTRVVRSVRLGKAGTIAVDDGGVRAQKAKMAATARGRKMPVIDVAINETGILGAADRGAGVQSRKRGYVPERRTKGGRKPKPRKKDLLTELEEL